MGFQKRNDTYTGKLAYIIYYDEHGKLRKETSWQKWREKEIHNELYENEPTEGFVLNKKVGGDNYNWNPRQTYTRVYDPRGFEFEITVPNLIWILENCNCIKGKGLEGRFVYGWDGTELLLVPVDSPDYEEIEQKSQVRNNNEFILPKDLIVGGTYETIDGVQYVFMGKAKPWEKEKNVYKVPFDYAFRGAYEYPLDETWKIDRLGGYRYDIEHPTYCRITQKPKNEFFFIELAHGYRSNTVVHMITVARKFSKLVLKTRSDFPELVDLLSRDNEYSPEDFEADKILELPFDAFLEKVDDMERSRSWCFCVGQRKKDFIVLREIRKECNGTWTLRNTPYISHYGLERGEEQRFWSLKECYAYIRPVYGERYLKNGYLRKRFYYD